VTTPVCLSAILAATPGLITGHRDGYLRNTLSQTLQHGIQAGMSDADRSALQQFQLRCVFDQDGVARKPPNLLWIDLIANRKHLGRPGREDLERGILVELRAAI
jgi:hypothetical protein